MGIVQEVIADFNLSTGQEWRVECNDNNLIHIHIDNFRYALTPDEFREFVRVLDEAESELREIKDTN